MTSRQILQVFEQYQKARLEFTKSVSELSSRHCNVQLLDNANVLELMKPLLSDPCKQVRQCATVALGRLIQHDAGVAKKMLSLELFGSVLSNIQHGNKYEKTSSLFVVRCICKHDAELASMVVEAGTLNSAIIIGLEDFETSVKESSAWVTGYIARHNADLALKCVDAGVVPLLILCLQESNISLKQIAASALSDIAKHNVQLGQCVVDEGAVPYLVKNLNNMDEKLKKQILAALSSCSKHSMELAEVVVDAEIFPSVFIHMAHNCPEVRRNATALVKDIVKHSLELTQLIVNSGGIGALIQVLHEHRNFSESILPCITALGYIAGHSEQLAMAVIGCQTVDALAEILNGTNLVKMTSRTASTVLDNSGCGNNEDAICSVCAWTLGQIGKHSPEHVKYIANANLFPILLQLYLSNRSSEDLKFKCKAALKMCLQKCLILSTLEPLLHDSPPNILKYILAQYSKVLPNDPKARRLFVSTGGLKKVQQIEAAAGSSVAEYIAVINSCFPVEIVRFYTPGYPDTLLDKVEQYSPQMSAILRETQVDDKNEFLNLDFSPSEELKNLLVG